MISGEKPLKILLVDDDEDVREITRTLLETAGHVVTDASSGPRALELFQPGMFDVVVTDFRMPEMLGDELVRQIRQQSPSQPVVYITGFADYADLKNERVVLKPFNLVNLLAAIESVLLAQPATRS